MDFDRFLALLDRTDYTKAHLLTMRENAVRENESMHVRAAEAALDRRFPSWRSIGGRKGGAQPTTVEFMGRRCDFDSQKEAYVWLVERFVAHYPKPFVELNWETAFIAKGPRSLYFARSLSRLFSVNAEGAAPDPTKWCYLTNGWYAKLVLSEKQKLQILRKFASLAKLEEGRDWRWSADGRLTPPEPGADLLRELDSL